MNNEQSSLATRARVYAALGDPSRLAIVDALLPGDASPGELASALGLPTNLLAHHVNVLAEVGLVRRIRSEGDRRRTYLRLGADALPALAATERSVPRVVFVCTHNSARSQLAAALWMRRSPVPAASAGTRPASRVHPRAVRVARRHGLSLDNARPVHADAVLTDDDLVIAVCDGAYEHLGVLRRPRLHWSVPDPARTDTDGAFEAVYDDLAGRIDRLAPSIALGRPE
jgi:protein-tyrosine-phosphatase